MIKYYIKLIYDHKINDFRSIESNDKILYLLRCFLTSEVGCYSQSWENWFLDPNQPDTIGNITIVEKNNYEVIFSDLFSEQPDKGPYLHIPFDHFMELLQQWKKFCKIKPKEILITYDDNNHIVMIPTYEKK